MPVRTPKETLEAAASAGCAKASLSGEGRPGRLLVLSILAGAYIALGGAFSVVIGFGFPEITSANPGLQRLLSALVFPIGLMLVVVLGADLFTGNNALLIPPAMDRRITPLQVAVNWILVWVGNFAGALAVTYLLIYLPGTLGSEPYCTAVRNIGLAKVSAPFLTIFLKGIGANWCVCLALWLALSGRRLGEKLLACEIPVAAFVALGFEHCIANMFFLPLAMMQGVPISVIDMLTANLLPATLGNIVGGALFVGAAYSYVHRR